MSTVRIKLVATPTDLDDDVRELLDDMDTQAFGSRYLYLKKGSYWWIAYDGAEPVGYAGMTPYPELSCGFLCRVAVAMSHRGQGLQRRFITLREQQCRKLRLSRAVTYVERSNIKSANNLIRRGYKLYSPPRHYGCAGALYFDKKVATDG